MISISHFIQAHPLVVSCWSIVGAVARSTVPLCVVRSAASPPQIKPRHLGNCGAPAVHPHSPAVNDDVPCQTVSNSHFNCRLLFIYIYIRKTKGKRDCQSYPAHEPSTIYLANMSTESVISLDYRGRVAVLTIDNDTKLNALSQFQYYDLAQKLREIATHDEVFITVILAKGRFFSAWVSRLS